MLVGVSAAALGCSQVPALAQESAPPPEALRIEVTGTNIKRTDLETALPVQVITREDIARGGSTTVAELMSKLSANLLSFNDQLSIGTQIAAPFQPLPRPGQSTINLRGIGDGSTLVLINGRRVANYAFDGGAVDVNSIPIAAIDRVEVLKDGASAIYGTDAIAGVVNFILRKDFSGYEASGYAQATGQGGGNQYQARISAGFGDLAKDRFNVFGSVNYQKDEALAAASRDFTRTGYRPDMGLLNLNALSFPANVRGPLGLVNPTAASGCLPPRSFPVLFDPNNTLGCGYDPQSLVDIVPPAERFNALGRATFQLAPDISVYADFAYSLNRLALTLPSTSLNSRVLTGGAQLLYPASGPYYPSAFAAANGITGDLPLFYRTESLGNRLDDIDSQAVRAVVGADGAFAGWDYSTALVYSRNTQSDDLARGYVSQQRLLQGLATGLINPFGPSGPEGDALLQSSLLDGDNYHTATGTTWLVDGHASRDIARLPGGPLAIAVGAEARKEQLANDFSPLAQSGDIVTIGDVASVAADRKVQALYGEASVPFAKGWESQIAVRYDHYSDFGGTVNPKISLRWQPVSQLLLRSSWGTGFRAPTLYDLHVAVQQMGTTDPKNTDPVRCPVTHASIDCDEGFLTLGGGNIHLAAETSEQFNAGAVWEPFAGTSVSIDYWKINKSNVIETLSEVQLFRDFSHWASTNVVRGPVDPAYPSLPGPIVSIFLGNENLGDLRTSGFDVDLKWRGPASRFGRFSLGLNGTYVTSYKLDLGTGRFRSGLGNNYVDFVNNGPRPVPRWRHSASINWSSGPWSATLAQTFQLGYSECDQLIVDLNNALCGGIGTRRVGDYSVIDIQGQYGGFKNTTIALGIKNLFDRAPPFTQFGGGFSGGYDPFYANPLGITYTRSSRTHSSEGMSDSTATPAPIMPATRPRVWLHGLGREGIAIVFAAAFVTALNTTVKFLVTVPLGEWLREFAFDFAYYLLIGSAVLIAAVWTRNAVPSQGIKQYAAVALAVVLAASVATVCLEVLTSGPVVSWVDLISVATAIVRPSFVGLIIASTWLYVRAEADHAAAIVTCTIDSERMDRETAEARLQVLEAQIEPHFLFNTLANVKRLYETDRVAGATMMRNLKDYLAVALPQMRAVACTLGRESDHAIAYLNIQQIRMGRRLAFDFDVPPQLRDARMPPLMLLTLVENAVKHGLTPRLEGGRIDVRARVVDEQLRIEVADTGQGFTKSGGGGTGLANTRARLASYFGGRGSLSLAMNSPQGIVATLVLPYERISEDREAR